MTVYRSLVCMCYVYSTRRTIKSVLCIVRTSSTHTQQQQQMQNIRSQGDRALATGEQQIQFVKIKSELCK